MGPRARKVQRVLTEQRAQTALKAKSGHRALQVQTDPRARKGFQVPMELQAGRARRGRSGHRARRVLTVPRARPANRGRLV